MLSHISYFLQMLFQNKGKSYTMLELLPPVLFINQLVMMGGKVIKAGMVLNSSLEILEH